MTLPSSCGTFSVMFPIFTSVSSFELRVSMESYLTASPWLLRITSPSCNLIAGNFFISSVMACPSREA